MQLRILCIGDIVGRPGRRILADRLGRFVSEREIHAVIANGENAVAGSGISAPIHEKLLSAGVDVVTMGDHTFRKREGLDVVGRAKQIVRPANFAKEALGKGYLVHELRCGVEVAVINLLGQLFMRTQADCPFHAVDACLKMIDSSVKIRIVDMHAEATSEKIAMGWYLDGRVTIVFGTHTHVATADERILPEGTAYISDVGMTGPHDSVLGRRKDRVVRALTTNMPEHFEVATGDVQINGVLVEADSLTGKASSIQRIRLSENGEEHQASYDADNGKVEPVEQDI